MALTQISTAGVKDDAVTSGKIPANAVGSSEIAANAVGTSEIAGDAVTSTELAANAVTTVKINNDAVNNSKLAANSVSTVKIADEAVTLAKLPHGTSSNDGKFLRANNGADPSFETVTSTTINNNADNRVITGSGTANTLEGESQLTYTSNTLKNIASGATNFLLGSTNAGGVKITLDGDSDGDGSASDSATIEHDTTGNLHIRTDNPASTCSMAFSTNGSIKAIFDGANGHFRPGADNTYDLGTSSFRWRDVYTNDLNLSNEGSSNDVDGTWGSYTIQEGAEDLFLINKRNGKKYKFNLTEVS